MGEVAPDTSGTNHTYSQAQPPGNLTLFSLVNPLQNRNSIELQSIAKQCIPRHRVHKPKKMYMLKGISLD
jgi:hypothetical protein